MKPKILVLFSGGLDSTVLLAWALRHGSVATLTFDYPDRPRGERRAAGRILRRLQVSEKYRQPLPEPVQDWVQGDADRAYIPGRNLYFQATGLLLARRIRATIVAAAHLDPDGHAFADARRTFFRRLEDVATAGQRRDDPRVRLAAPFLHLTKTDLADLAHRWAAPVELSWSCYRNGAQPCGRCVACRERQNVFSRGAPLPRRRWSVARPPAQGP